MKLRLSSPIKRSDIDFFIEGRRTPDYGWFDWLHGFVYGRWVYLYIGLGIGEHPIAKRLGPPVGRIIKRFSHKRGSQVNEQHGSHVSPRLNTAETYHGKVMSLENARQLVMVNEDIRLPDLEKIIPYQKAKDIVLKNPDHIVVLDCPCRVSRADPCLPLDVCLIVGEPFATYVHDHHPQRSRWITQQQAVTILEAEHQRGHVHHAFFKDAMLGRFYAVCNCCACCCGAMQAQRRGTPMLTSSGYVARVDESLCIGCEVCEQNCQFDAVHLDDFVSRVDYEACMGCGVCVSLCEQDAISLERAPEKGEPLEILALLAEARQVQRELIDSGR